MHRPAHLLIVDDDDTVRWSLRKALSSKEVVLEEAKSGEEALELLATEPFDMVLTDIRMGKVGGIDLLAQTKDRWPDTTVILLTGYASVESTIQALRSGAHDYLLKPVSLHEVRESVRQGLAKHREVLRRRDVLSTLREGILSLGEEKESIALPPRADVGERLVVDTSRHLVAVDGKTVDVTPTEYQLLLILLEQQGRVLDYQEIVHTVYGYKSATEDAKQLIMPHISNLRHKLRAASHGRDLIRNVRGVGYILSTSDK